MGSEGGDGEGVRSYSPYSLRPVRSWGVVKSKEALTGDTNRLRLALANVRAANEMFSLTERVDS